MFELLLNYLCRSLLSDIVSGLLSHRHPLQLPSHPLPMLRLKGWSLLDCWCCVCWERWPHRIFIESHSSAGEKVYLPKEKGKKRVLAIVIWQDVLLVLVEGHCTAEVLPHGVHVLGSSLHFAHTHKLFT